MGVNVVDGILVLLVAGSTFYGWKNGVLRLVVAVTAAMVGFIAGRELYEPVAGIFSAAALSVVRRRGWQPLLWSRWGRDWSAAATPSSIVEKVTRALAPGDVLLLHDSDAYSVEGSWRQTVAALPRVLEELSRRGLPAELPRGPEHW